MFSVWGILCRIEKPSGVIIALHMMGVILKWGFQKKNIIMFWCNIRRGIDLLFCVLITMSKGKGLEPHKRQVIVQTSVDKLQRR